MQQVKLKKGSMSEARYGNDDEYYLRSIDSSGYALLTVIKDVRIYPLCVCVVELEPVVQEITLPVDIIENEYYP